jgi:hypothetical protein
VLKYWPFLVEYHLTFLAKKVDCVHKLSLILSLTNDNKHIDSNLNISFFKRHKPCDFAHAHQISTLGQVKKQNFKNYTFF